MVSIWHFTGLFSAAHKPLVYILQREMAASHLTPGVEIALTVTVMVE
jgi:hypothetical protein